MFPNLEDRCQGKNTAVLRPFQVQNAHDDLTNPVPELPGRIDKDELSVDREPG